MNSYGVNPDKVESYLDRFDDLSAQTTKPKTI